MKTDNKLTRMLRLLRMPKERVAEFYRRYERFTYYRLCKYGPGETRPANYDKMRRMQLQINTFNASHEEDAKARD